MKRLILLIILYGLCNTALGQSPSAAIDSLVRYQIITAKQRPVLEKELRDYGRTSYPVAILGGLENVLIQKEFHLDPHRTGLYVSYGDGYRNKKSRDSINAILRPLLEKINRAGLLTDRVYTYTRAGIDSGWYVAEVQLIAHLAEMSSRLEWLAPNRLLPVAEQLHQYAIVSDSSFSRLESDIRNRKIESAFQLIAYCTLARTFDVTKYPDEPALWLEQLHRDIASMLPGLNFAHFSYTTAPDTTLAIGAEPGIKYVISITCNGHTYKHSSSTFNFGKMRGKLRPRDILTGSFFRIFNKILADRQSPFRLHSVMLSHTSAADDNLQHIALIALRERQAEVFMKDPCLSYMLVSMENHDNTLTSGRVDSTLAAWRKIGLFAHLSEVQIKKATDDSEAGDLFSINALLANFPGVTYSLRSALLSPHYAYVNLLSQLAKITHGAFNPTRITQKKVGGGIKLQYFSKGKIHSYKFNTAYGWMDPKFPAFMKQLRQENNLPGEFYQLRYEDSVIYLTKQQHGCVVSRNLLDLSATKPTKG